MSVGFMDGSAGVPLRLTVSIYMGGGANRYLARVHPRYCSLSKSAIVSSPVCFLLVSIDIPFSQDISETSFAFSDDSLLSFTATVTYSLQPDDSLPSVFVPTPVTSLPIAGSIVATSYFPLLGTSETAASLS